MLSILEICAFISYIYFKTIVIDNLRLFRKLRGSWCVFFFNNNMFIYFCYSSDFLDGCDLLKDTSHSLFYFI